MIDTAGLRAVAKGLKDAAQFVAEIVPYIFTIMISVEVLLGAKLGLVNRIFGVLGQLTDWIGCPAKDIVIGAFVMFCIYKGVVVQKKV